MIGVRAIVLDIEGTIAPIAFVRDVLFPYARAHLPEFLARHGTESVVAAQLAAVRALAPGAGETTTLLAWMDQDLKIPPLKALQGMVWQAGYDAGTLEGVLYGDVAPQLAQWRDEGMALYIYSSGSVTAQQLLLGHSNAGDLRPLLAGYFDTGIGAKREAASYLAIAQTIGVDGNECLFLSDVEAELDAAAAAGWQTAQLVRSTDGTVASGRHRNCGSLGEV